MKRIKTILAAAATLALISALAAPAYADPVQVNQTIQQQQGGRELNLQIDSDGNNANIQDSAFMNATGNVGANVSAGDGNQQSNVALIDRQSPTYNFSGDYEQGIVAEGSIVSGLEHASISGNAFEYASGDVNANVASGLWNQQGNAMFVAADDTLKGQTVGMTQDNTISGCAVCGLNNAHVNGNAFDHSTGSVNANVAAGDMNQQLNSMAITADSGKQNVDMEQVSLMHLYLVDGLNDAIINDNAFSHATGNLGVNVASGAGNQQENRSNIDNGDDQGDTTTIGQFGGASFTMISGGNVANIAGNAFENASGQIGVNDTAGYANQQANALSVSH
jgi:hypothetical protein